MKKIDLRETLNRKKYSTKATEYIWLNPKISYIGFGSATRNKYNTGIGFLRITKKGDIRKTRNGQNRWYFGCNNSFTKAISFINQYYGFKLPRKDWTKYKVTSFNRTESDELIKTLLNNLQLTQ